jgi:plastocyanin
MTPRDHGGHRLSGDTGITSGRRAATRGQRWTAVGVVAVSLLALAACAPSGVAALPGAGSAGSPGTSESETSGTAAGSAGTAAGSQRSPASGRKSAASSASNGVDLTCTKATRTTIVQRAAGGASYAFSPRRLSIKRGAFLAVTNTSDRAHALIATPDAGIVTSVVGRGERQVIQFPEAGTFTVASAAPAHRAVLRVTVVGESGCGPTKPTVTLVDGYSITPARLSVAATENFAVVNESGAVQAVRCTPGRNGDNPRLARGETQLLALDEPGRYVCASVQHPEAKVTIRVR